MSTTRFDKSKPYICTNPLCEKQFLRPSWWWQHANKSDKGCGDGRFSVKSLQAYEDDVYQATQSQHDGDKANTCGIHISTPTTHPNHWQSSQGDSGGSLVPLPNTVVQPMGNEPPMATSVVNPELSATQLEPVTETPGDSSHPGISPLGSDQSAPPRDIEVTTEVPGEHNYKHTYMRTKVKGGFEYLHPTAGKIYGKGKSRWERAHEDNLKHKRNRWGIFGSERQWQIGFWMGMSKTSQRDLDELLKTHIMSGLSFRRAKKLFRIVEKKMALFAASDWHEADITLDDAPSDSHTLWYRDISEALDDLLGRPTLAKQMTYGPKIHMDEDDQTRRYGNPCTGKLWNRLQSKAPIGTTIGGVMIASDKTHLSTHGGNVSAHAVYVTLANIDKSIRNQVSHNTWVLVAYIPVSKFVNTMLEHEEKSKQARARIIGLLNRRLFHQCLSVITRPLRRTNPHMVTGPDGNIRSVLYKLMAYIADFEEQAWVAGIGSRSCPHCLANSSNLGDPTKQPTRTSDSILKAIQTVNKTLAEKYPENRYTAIDFLDEGTKVGLNGVDKPFWRSIPDCNISEVLSPDLLHGFHKFFYDHVFDWNSISLGDSEIDARMRSQVRLVGDRAYPNGVSHLSQTTMKEHRDFQRFHLPVVACAPIQDSRRVTEGTRAIIDCIYLAQFSSHSDISLNAYRNSHATFHEKKAIWIDNKSRLGGEKKAGGKKGDDGQELESRRKHFHIPKLHILRHLPEHIELKGTADNYTTEAMEHLHIDLVKNAYRASNRRNWKRQTTRWLTRREKIKDFDAWIKWCQETNVRSTGIDYEREDPIVLERDWADEDNDNESEVDEDEDSEVLEDEALGDEVHADEDGNFEKDTQPFEEWLLEADGSNSTEPELQPEAKTGVETEEEYDEEQVTKAANPMGEIPRKRKRVPNQQQVRTTTRKRTRTEPVRPIGITEFQSVRIKPYATKQPIHRIMAEYDVPDLLVELRKHPYSASRYNLPDEHSTIDIWPYIRVQPPTRLHARAAGLQRVRTSRLGLHFKSGPAEPCDPIMYLNEPGVPSSSTRVSDCSVGQLTLLFRISPSVAERNTPILAYIHRFTKITHRPDPLTGMYIVRKERRTNGNQFGRVIEASRIVRLCPLSPVISNKANRTVTPDSVLSFYDSFYINKYHSHELFEYLHEFEL